MEKNVQTFELLLPGASEPIIFETGWKAKQANGSIWIKQGGTVVLVTAVSGKAPSDYIDFFPLTVNYVEKFYSVGKIPGGFFKRETKPSDKETLVARLIDRPLRPMFADGFRNETQVIATVVSMDQVHAPDILALNAASAALTISDIPFLGPIAGVRVGKLNGELVINPKMELVSQLTMNIVVAGTSDAICMVEAGMDFASEDEVVEALMFGHEAIKKIIELQLEMKEKIGKPKMTYTDFSIPADMKQQAMASFGEKIREALLIPGKLDKYAAIDAVKEEFMVSMKETLGDVEFAAKKKMLNDVYGGVEKHVFRRYTLDSKKRADGRDLEQVRPIDIETTLLPCTHGSALFTRGETQALTVVTLGTKMDSQMVDNIEGEGSKRFNLHYNFPPFSVGEVGFLRAPGRREIGHGNLAERALSYIVPSEDEFPYTIRIVSEVLESNGSSSMATVCGGTLCMMDGGVPIKAPIAGIAMGLIYESGEYVILSDIMGLEDHLGDMDFKVAGSRDGITALQMDIKIEGLSREILANALKQAYAGRMHILDKMDAALSAPREELAPSAPRFVTKRIDPEKTGMLIGPQGKNIKGIIEATGASIDIMDGGIVNIYAKDKASIDAALAMVEASVGEAELGKTYRAKVKRVMEYGAFVEFLPGTEGLLHVSQYSHERVKTMTDVVKIGDMLDVEYQGKDERGRMKLSRKALLEKPAGKADEKEETSEESAE